MPIIPTLGRQRLEEHELMASPGSGLRPKQTNQETSRTEIMEKLFGRNKFNQLLLLKVFSYDTHGERDTRGRNKNTNLKTLASIKCQGQTRTVFQCRNTQGKQRTPHQIPPETAQCMQYLCSVDVSINT